jgi:peptide/nickel transport system substrate-binding protein
MQQTTRRLSWTAIAIAFGSGLLVAGCKDNDPKINESSAVVALLGDASSLNPIFETAQNGTTIFRGIFDGLTAIDGNGALVPDLATSWEANETMTTWVYQLREDAKFSDGSPFTADDVVFTYTEAKTAEGSQLASVLGRVEKVTATGEFEVTFELSAPYAPFPAITTISIVPEAVYTTLGAEGFANDPVGSGPYKVEEWNKGVSIELARNDLHWGDQGSVEALTYQIVADENARATSIQSGSLSVGLLSPAQIPAVDGSDTVEIVTQPSNQVIYMGLNQQSTPALAELGVRKAVRLAIDLEGLNENLLNGTLTPTSQLIAPSVFGYNKDLVAPEYDIEQAQQLIADSDYDGSTIVLSYPTSGLPQISELAQAIASAMEATGLTVKLDGQEAGTFLANWFAGELPGAYIFAFAPSTMDASLPYLLLAASGHTGSFTDARIDELSTAELSEGDLDERLADFVEMSEIIADQAYYVPLFTNSYVYGVQKGIDWTPRPDGFITF